MPSKNARPRLRLHFINTQGVAGELPRNGYCPRETSASRQSNQHLLYQLNPFHLGFSRDAATPHSICVNLR
jgi:hypothetical protein